MINKNFLFSFAKKTSAMAAALLLHTALYAFDKNDSPRNVLLAAATVKPEQSFIIKEANVVYPLILQGNEKPSLEYIENFSDKRREYLLRMYAKGKKIFPKVAAILRRHNLPEELKVLIALESAFKGSAVSKAGAVGYWQFMEETANEYGLRTAKQFTAAEKKKLIKKDRKKADSLFKVAAKQKDDRKNFNKSTWAAARYLKDRGRNLNNDWLLVVASYNCGVGNVWDAIAASGKTNAGFWDVKDLLPAETQAYVMNFIAMNVVFHNYENFSSKTLSFKPVKIPADNFEQHIMNELGKPAALR